MNSATWIDMVNLVAIFTVYAVSVNLIVGYAGIPAVVPAAFGAVGGYASGYLVTVQGWSPVLALVAGVIGGGLIGLVLSGPSLRLSMEYVILLTFAGAYVILGVIANIPELGGPGGLFLPKLEVLGYSLDTLGSYVPWLVGIAALSYLISRRIADSLHGLVLKGIREDPLAAAACGFNTVSARTTTFVMSAALSGLAGGLHVLYIAVASPAVFGFTQGIILVTMVIVGGLGRPIGPVVGAVLVTATPRLLQNLGGFSEQQSAQVQQVIFGLLLIAVIMLRPAGIVAEIPSRLVRRRARREGFMAAPAPEVGVCPAPPHGADASPGEAEVLVHEVSEVDLETVVVAADAEPDMTSVHGRAPGDVQIAISAKELRKKFGGLVVADGFDFELPTGGVVGLVGPNGAGKTTLFNLLSGAIRPDSGAVSLFGEDVTGRRADQIVGHGLVRTFQEVRLFPALTVYENVLLGAARPRTASLLRTLVAPRAVRTETQEALDRAAAALRLVSMEHKAMERASSLSFGEQKLVALARAVATDAKVLLLDEPAAGVGTEIARQILDLIAGLGRQGVTVLLVEHNLEVVREVATSVYYLEAGGIRAHGTYEELTSDPQLAASYFGTVAEVMPDAAPAVLEGGAR